VAYLLALRGEVAEVCKGNGIWEPLVKQDVLRWAEMEAASLGTWWEGVRMLAETFFLRNWKGDPSKVRRKPPFNSGIHRPRQYNQGMRWNERRLAPRYN
jgi:hypothetical protein